MIGLAILLVKIHPHKVMRTASKGCARGHSSSAIHSSQILEAIKVSNNNERFGK